MILALDANGDGEVSAEEIANGPAALMKLDTNGDGRVGREEMRPPDGGQGRQGPGGPQGNGPRDPAPDGRPRFQQ